MYPIDLNGKTGVVFGVANHRSIAWAIAQILHEAGAELAVAYQNERVHGTVEKLVADWEGDTQMIECDVSDDANIERAIQQVGDKFGKIDIIVHSIAFADRDDLGGAYMKTGREGFRMALDVSAYSLIPIARSAAGYMTEGGSILAMTFQAAERVFPGYNVMGTAKAALENAVKQLASDLGEQDVRVNAISAGPLDTLSSPRHQQVPRHEARPRRAVAHEAQHHVRRGRQDSVVPVQRPVERRHRRDRPRRHRL